MRMHPNETLLIIHQEQAERRRAAAERALAVRQHDTHRDTPPSDVLARAFGRPALSHPLRPWSAVEVER
jgi:hypothetical protein